jgi:hypothetical protein
MAGQLRSLQNSDYYKKMNKLNEKLSQALKNLQQDSTLKMENLTRVISAIIKSRRLRDLMIMR